MKLIGKVDFSLDDNKNFTRHKINKNIKYDSRDSHINKIITYDSNKFYAND